MTTLTLDAHRRQMIHRLESQEGYSFLGMAGPYLKVAADDHYIRFMAVREYLKLGLVLPAKELVEEGGKSAAAPEEFRVLQESLAEVRGGFLPWSEASQRFHANLAALENRGVDATAIRSRWEARRTEYQRFRDANGIDQVRARDGQGRWQWIPSLSHHKRIAEAQALPEGVGQLMPGPYVFEGLDLGSYFQRVYDATKNTFLGYSCALFVVEPDPAALALVFHLHDWRVLLADSRVFWFFGADCAHRLREAWDEDWNLPLPRQAFTLSAFRPRAAPNVIEVVQEAGTRRERQIRDSYAELEVRYAHCDIRFWRERFREALSGCGPPLRILAAVSTHTTFLQYSMRDTQRALESLGHTCRVLTEKASHDVVGPLTFHQAIRELHPDLFFSLDHLRPEFENLIPGNLPILTWDQDQLPHVFTPENMRRVAKHDFLAGCSKSKWVMEGLNPKQFLHARLPTCPEQFSGPPLTPQEHARYGCDVSYVSHASQTARAFHDEQRAQCGDARLATILDHLFEKLPEALRVHRIASGPLADELLDQASRRCGISVLDPNVVNWIRCWYLWRLGDRIFRHEALEWVADWAQRSGRSLRIYGNGWDQHPTLSTFAAGPAENGRELLCIYRASRINLQLMPAGFIHQRALDGLAAGGFFLTRRVPQDFLGKPLRRLYTRTRELDLSDSHQILASNDAEVRTLLQTCYGPWLRRADSSQGSVCHELELSCELEYPDEVFPGFEQINFDSSGQFASVADHFLSNDSVRSQWANRMREVVVQRFTYQPTLARFISSMANHLSA